MQCLPIGCQGHTTVLALEQRNPKITFQSFYLMADGTRGDRQFLCRILEA